MSKQKDLFNPLFQGQPVKIPKRHRDGNEKKEKPKAEPHKNPSRKEPGKYEFIEAMSGVNPLPHEERKRIRPGGARSRPAAPAPDERREKISKLGQEENDKKKVTNVGPGKGHQPHEPGQNEFIKAMSGVEPLLDEPRQRVRPGGLRSRPAVPAPDEQREVIGHLRQLVKGAIDLDITFSDEYIEGSVRGFDHELMKKLKRGEFPVQDHIDLHGLTREEAEAAIKNFILTSFRLGLRCLLIIHGRGLNSPESFPVLKEGLPIWLGRGPVKRIVLAFATARPYDGGTGAVYVLLRRR
jgi:DNA-nicking Smr family endonuclease